MWSLCICQLLDEVCFCVWLFGRFVCGLFVFLCLIVGSGLVCEVIFF